MSSFLFDTNALIYWTYQRSPFHEEVSKLLEASLQSKNSICALASSLKDVYFALCSHYTDEVTARRSIALIAEVFDLVDLSGLLVWDAIDSDEPDYEDGLIRAAAEALQVDAIITYDKKAFRNSSIPSLTAQEAYRKISD